MYEWYINEWIHLVAIHPETRACYYFKEGVFEPYDPSHFDISPTGDFHRLVESANGMETNQIADATKENLPVYTLN